MNRWISIKSTNEPKHTFNPHPPVPQREKIREKFVAALQKEFAGKGLRFTRGEQEMTSPAF